MKATIVMLPGDGIGPEVTAAAGEILQTVARRWGHEFVLDERPIGGAAIDACGEPLPAETLAACRQADAVFLGAVGGPQWSARSPDARPEAGLLALRRALGLFANLRPVRPDPHLVHSSPLRPERLRNVDMLIVRELTGGIYFGEKRRDTHRASDLCVYTVEEVERIVRTAAGFARARRGRLTSVDKANVLETSRLWRETVDRLGATEFPDLEIEHLLVDAAAMHLLQRPADFDVLVTENMFGDILTDEASVLAGSLGLLPSASLGAPGPGLYEPIHGSAPDIAGTDIANPYGAILSVALLLRHALSLGEEAAAVEKAVSDAISAGIHSADLGPDGRSYRTSEIAAAVSARLGRRAQRQTGT